MFDPGIIAAFLSAVATALAAYTTWKGPLSAAKLAENLRVNSEEATEKRKAKNYVFLQLMQERSTLSSQEGVKALNLIDVVFVENKPVREAWAALFETFDTAKAIPTHTQQERLRILLKEMAADLGLANELRLADLERVYYPTVLAQENHIRFLEREQTLTRLLGQPASGNTAVNSAVVFPPRPSSQNGSV